MGEAREVAGRAADAIHEEGWGRIVKLLAAGVSFRPRPRKHAASVVEPFRLAHPGKKDAGELDDRVSLALPEPENLDGYEPRISLVLRGRSDRARVGDLSTRRTSRGTHGPTGARATRGCVTTGPDLWGDHTKGDPLPGPKKKARARAQAGRNDLAGEISAARVRPRASAG